MTPLLVTAHKAQIFTDYLDHLAAGKLSPLTKVELSMRVRE